MKQAGRLPANRIQITRPVRAIAYRARVQPFAALKFLDMRALSRTRRASIEIGTVETRKGTVTVVAHIRNGAVVALAPKGCDGCLPRKGKKPDRSQVKAAVRALERAGVKRLGAPRLPLKISPGTSAARLALGRIVVIDIDIHWFDICIIYIASDGSICMWCLFGPSVCVDTISGAG